MIKITYNDNQITVIGHANYDCFNKDIVCASVSGIVMGAINWFKKNEINLLVDQAIPKIELSLKKPTQSNQKLIKLIIVQLEGISDSYPQYLKLKKI